MKLLYFLTLQTTTLLLSGRIPAQHLYSIEITHNLYRTDYDSNEYLYQANKFSISASGKASRLVRELENTKSLNQAFNEMKVDTNTILHDPLQLLKYYDDNYFRWNKQQMDFIKDKLTQLGTYRKYFAEYLSFGEYVNGHDRYREEYVIKIFKNDSLKETYISRRSLTNSKKIPWTNNKNIPNYNILIDKILFDILGNRKQYQNIVRKKPVLKYLINRIINSNKKVLYELSALDYNEEFNELQSDFDILNTGEVYQLGRYIWDEPKTYYARLKNDSMLPRINIMFLASKKGKSIYSRDSIKAEYREIIGRVQQVEFLVDHISKDPSVNLDIYYFNNNPVNEYNIENFNKNAGEWSKHDKYLESIKRYEREIPRPNFADTRAINTSKQLYCGCNYRFGRSFAEKAIFIELQNRDNRENSVWYLLPDNTVLLYIMQGEKVLDYPYTQFGESPGIQYPCVLFDLKGNIIDKR